MSATSIAGLGMPGQSAGSMTGRLSNGLAAPWSNFGETWV